MRISKLAVSALFLTASLASSMDLPRPAPAAVWRLPNGGTLDLASYKGKIVGLEFLLTTCPHCQKCSEILQKMQTEFGPKGFQALGVAVNDMAHMLIPDYVRKFRLSYPIAFGTREEAHDFVQHSRMLNMYYPQLVFIDRKGIIRAHYPGGDKFYTDEEKNMRAQIEALLKEPATSAVRSKVGAAHTNGKSK